MLKQVFVLLALGFLAAEALTWRNCDGNAPVLIHSLHLRPDPIVLRAGANFTFGGQLRVSGEAGTRYKAYVKLQKKAWFWFTIPCLKSFGSCTYSGIQCKHIKKWVGTCPLQHGTIDLNEHSINMPNLPPFIMKGLYYVKLDVWRADEIRKRVACLEIYLKI